MVEKVKSNYSVTWSQKIAEIPQSAWDELAVPLKTPFLEWEWLNNLEISSSVLAKYGWLPNHLVIWQGHNLIAAAPLYLKGHSYGEFVFDHQWADVAELLEINYYPKLLGMTPFTPVEGYRFLISPAEDEAEITAIMLYEIDRFCIKYQLSGCHFLFVDPQWKPLIEIQGFASWLHHSYVWNNLGFNRFNDYLSIFNSSQRRNIKRERKAIVEKGIQMQFLTGDYITNDLLRIMHDFYADTCDKFGGWGSKYLTKRFFELLYNYRHRVILIAAYDENNKHKPIGMSFCLYKSEYLYGRYWGSCEDINNLHFDVCYYAPIEWAIANKIQIFDPGAGGEHKKRRGFSAKPNHSLHRFYNNYLHNILCAQICKINELEQQEIIEINSNLPFSKNFEG